MTVSTSFRMVDGRVRNLGGHIRRLKNKGGLTDHSVAALRDHLRAAGPDPVWPIVHADAGSWDLEIRPDQPIKEDIVLDTVAHPDHRLTPRIKGPDLSWLREKRRLSVMRGADEGLLADPVTGRIIEGVYTAIISFSGSTACISTHPRALHSTTAEQIIPFLADCGLRVIGHRKGFTLETLRATDLWLLNAFYGVQHVTGWVDYGIIFPSDAPVGGFPTTAEANDWLWKNAEAV